MTAFRDIRAVDYVLINALAESLIAWNAYDDQARRLMLNFLLSASLLGEKPRTQALSDPSGIRRPCVVDYGEGCAAGHKMEYLPGGEARIVKVPCRTCSLSVVCVEDRAHPTVADGSLSLSCSRGTCTCVFDPMVSEPKKGTLTFREADPCLTLARTEAVLFDHCMALLPSRRDP